MSRRATFLTLVFAACALLSAAPASAKSPFPLRYHGNASGTRTISEEGRTLNVSWNINDLKFKRKHVRTRWGTSTAFYKVTAGTLVFHAEESGTCSFTVDKTMPLLDVIDQFTSAPFTLTPKGRKFSVQGLMSGDDTLSATETCPNGDGDPPTVDDVDVVIGTLMDYGSKARATRAKAKGSNTEKIEYSSGAPGVTSTFSWNFKS